MKNRVSIVIAALLAAMLVPLCALVGGVSFMMFVDVRPPSRLIYQAPTFLGAPAANRYESQAYAITEKEGGETVWRYLEWCLDEAVPGEIRRAWVGEKTAHSESKPTLGKVGCYAKSVGHVLPVVTEAQRFVWSQIISYQLNPFSTVVVTYPEIPITVLPRDDDDAQ